MEQADYVDMADWAGRTTRRKWHATAWGLTVTFTTDNLELQLFRDPIQNMREVGIALVDETRTMKANIRRDRKGNE